jgi:hypothetical protein
MSTNFWDDDALRVDEHLADDGATFMDTFNLVANWHHASNLADVDFFDTRNGEPHHLTPMLFIWVVPPINVQHLVLFTVLVEFETWGNVFWVHGSILR